jgi:aminoglycoside phosphotransferase (APT) family kinase protein
MTQAKTENNGMDIKDGLQRILAKQIDGFRSISSCERLSGGASQETYRIVIETEAGQRKLAMRRAP